MKTHIAAFIVIAANSHDLLLKVAKEIEAAMALAGCPSSALVASMNAIDRLRPHLLAVIAAAEEKARQGTAGPGMARPYGRGKEKHEDTDYRHGTGAER